MKAGELVGQTVFRTRKNSEGDGSYTTTPTIIVAVTDNHIYHRSTEKGSKIRLLNYTWMDDHWIKWLNPKKFAQEDRKEK